MPVIVKEGIRAKVCVEVVSNVYLTTKKGTVALLAALHNALDNLSAMRNSLW